MDNTQNTTNNIAAQNKDMEVLKQHFSHCFDKEGNFDFSKFKEELSHNEINISKESYGMEWLGKSYARILASDNATTLLREDEAFNQKEENRNSENILIKGDNLEILKHLSNAYYEKIKMIYIDPPYNTGSDGFVYQDDRKFTAKQLQELAGLSEEKAKRILSFTQSKSNSHSAWLTFMYPRLYIAKQLMREDGVILISIDENEHSQLRLLMDEIFGEENFSGDIVWKNSSKNDQDYISIQHEYILVYTKNKTFNSGEWQERKEGLSEIYKAFNRFKKEHKTDWKEIHKEGLEWYKQYPESNPIKDSKHYNWMDEKGVYFPDNISGPNDGQYVYDVLHPTTNKVVKLPSRGWVCPKTKMLQLIKDDRVHFGADEKTVPCLKTYLKNTEYRSLTSVKFRDGRIASKELKKLMGKKCFTNPKDPQVLQDYMKAIGISNNDLVLDFFAGSGTTGDAVVQLNAEDGNNRRFILAQIPEAIENKSKSKVAYAFVKNELKIDEPTVFEITKERLIRSTKKIKDESIETSIAAKQKEIKSLKEQLDIDDKEEKIKTLKAEMENLKNQDLGFKVYETMPIWDDYGFEADELHTQLSLFDQNKLSEEDLKALLLTWKTNDGIELTQTPQEIKLGNYKAHYVSNKLYLMHKGFATDSLKSLLEEIDSNKTFNPTSIIAFGYHFESKSLREIAENIKSYANKKNIDIDFITRY